MNFDNIWDIELDEDMNYQFVTQDVEEIKEVNASNAYWL